MKISLIAFFTPFLLAILLTLVYSVIPPLSLPVIGRTLALKEIHWRWRSLDNISPNLARMVLSAEDARFCKHGGVDWKAVEKVVDKAQKRRKITHGASTVPMQTAKNLFLWPLPDIMRKPLEVPLAMWMDWIWSKRRMMEIYLNVAQFGDGVYGAEAAARYHFKKRAKDLTVGEASLLAASLPNPVKRSASKPSKYVSGYAAKIRGRANTSLTTCLK